MLIIIVCSFQSLSQEEMRHFLLMIKFLKLLVIQVIHGLRSYNCVNSHH